MFEVNNVVTDDELLYRCVFRGLDKYYYIDESGSRVSSQAFTDTSRLPSVDRAKLCNHDPKWTQKHPEDGVVSLITGEVRLIDNIVQRDSKGNVLSTYKIDVCPRPDVDNPSHAQIEPSPDYKNGTPFKKVLEKLAFLANQKISKEGWEIEPYELRT